MANFPARITAFQGSSGLEKPSRRPMVFDVALQNTALSVCAKMARWQESLHQPLRSTMAIGGQSPPKTEPNARTPQVEEPLEGFGRCL